MMARGGSLEPHVVGPRTAPRPLARTYTNHGVLECYESLQRIQARTPELPFKRRQIPSNRDHKALDRGTLGGVEGLVAFEDRFLKPLPGNSRDV